MSARVWRWCLVALATGAVALGGAVVSVSGGHAGAAAAHSGVPAGPAAATSPRHGATSAAAVSTPPSDLAWAATAASGSALHPIGTPLAAADAPPSPSLAAPSHLSIPAIGLETEVAVLGWSVRQTDDGPVSEWDALPTDRAAWLPSSAMPGAQSNVVITGHHNVGAEVFRDLYRLAEGDEIILTAGNQTFRYTVSEHYIVPEGDASEEQHQRNGAWMKPSTCERLTLITCWPYETNSHRLVIIADPLPSDMPVAG